MAKDYWSWGTTKSRRGLFHFPSKAACSGYTLGYNWTCPGFSFSQSDKWERGGVSVQPLLQIEGGGKRLKVKDYVICDQLLAPDDNNMNVPCPATAQHDCVDIGALHSWLEGPHLVILSYLYQYTYTPRALDTMDTCTYLVLLHPLSLYDDCIALG